jgi:hypothetical protein
MYMDYPRPEHKRLAEELMAKGADLILMHHAHVLQGIQVTQSNRLCCYNLGNFVFDWEEGNVKISTMLQEQTESAVFLFDLDRHGVAGAYAIPIRMDSECRVRWATGEQGAGILKRLQRISEELHGNFAAVFERQRAERNTAAILKVVLFHARNGNWRFLLDCGRRVRPEHLKMVFRWVVNRFSPQPQ